jgi:hypothetical protein
MHNMKQVLHSFVSLSNQAVDGAAMPQGAPKTRRLLGEIHQPVEGDASRTARLPVRGQGTVAFNVKNFGPTPPQSYRVYLLAADSRPVAVVTVKDTAIEVELLDKNGQRRTATSSRLPEGLRLIGFTPSDMFIWASMDRANGTIQVGDGYMMRRNTRITLVPGAEVSLRDMQRAIEEIEQARIDDEVELASNTKISRMPVVLDPPPVVIDRNSITLEHLARNDAIADSTLPEEAQYLYGTVAGNNITLSPRDAAAIDFSLDTDGMTLFEKVKEKLTEFGDDPKMVYIRVTIGPDEGDSPGSPFVLEIWPKGCYSPVHSHSETVAVIKVLHGDIKVRWYNPLAQKDNDHLAPLMEQTFSRGDVTWLTPEMYQTHKLENPRTDTMCATIQSYRYLDRDNQHYEFFDYVSPDPGVKEKQQFRPDSDYELLDLLRIVRHEYDEHGPGKSP